jgi:hypothetical protein
VLFVPRENRRVANDVALCAMRRYWMLKRANSEDANRGRQQKKHKGNSKGRQ